MASLSENMAALQGILGAQQQGFKESRARAMAPEREAMEREKFRQNQLINQLNIQEAQQALPLQQQLLQSKVEALPIQRQLDQLKLQKLEQQLQTGRQGIAETGRQSKIRDIIAIGNIAEQVKAQNIQDPQERLSFARGLMAQAGYEGIIRPGDESIDKLNMAIAARDSLIKSSGAMDKKGLQFGAQQTFKDSKGNLFFGTQKRDPSTGETQSTLSPIGNAPAKPVGQVQMVGSFGETAQESLNRKLAEAKAKADIDLETDISKLTGKKREERIDTVIDTAIASASVIPTYDRMLELIDSVSTGGVQAGIQRARQLFGWEAADLGELDALFKESVLSNIKQLGANPTDSERTFIIEVSGSIGQNAQVLKRLMNRRKKQAQNSVEKGLKFAKDRGDEDALFLIQGEKTTPPQRAPGSGVQTENLSTLSDEELMRQIQALEGNQ